MGPLVDTILDNVKDVFTPESKKPPRCKAITKKGKPCTNPARPNGYCRVRRHGMLAESQQEDPATTTQNPTPGQEITDQDQSNAISESPHEDLATTAKSLPIRQHVPHPLDTARHTLDGADQHPTENGDSAFNTPDNVYQSSTDSSAGEREDVLGKLPRTPAKLGRVFIEGGNVESTPLSGSRGSSTNDLTKIRRAPMASDLAEHFYQSSTVIERFLKDVPLIDEKVINDLRELEKWKNFEKSCTGSKGKGKSQTWPRENESNEAEFMDLVRCIAGLRDIEGYFRRQQIEEKSGSDTSECRPGPRRISHQGNCPMYTWNPTAAWLRGGVTEKKQELKPDFMTLQVQVAKTAKPRKAQERYVMPSLPQTILPPPGDWRAKWMKDESFPIVECRDPVWECLELFWECKRNQEKINDIEVILDCALKATETLRYQWSRRFVYCFLHCGTKMKLLQFDRSGLLASEEVDVVDRPDIFVRCLIGAFCHDVGRLGFPNGSSAPRHEMVNKMLRQVVTVQGKELYLIDQVAGPIRDHLVSRATVAFKAKLLKPKDNEADRVYCFKSSWPQKVRQHEGSYLEFLQGTLGVVSLLAYDVPQVELGIGNAVDDTTGLGRGYSGKSTQDTSMQKYLKKIKYQLELGSTAQITTSKLLSNDDTGSNLHNNITFDDKEHRQIVCAWVEDSFDYAVSKLTKQPDISSLWQGAFLAMDAIVKKGIMHRDISFRNVRVDQQNRVYVCDFDMATKVNYEWSGAFQKTGTIEFMATALLTETKTLHKPVHDCESVFWMCVLSLLKSTAIERHEDWLRKITSPDTDLKTVGYAKAYIVGILERLQRGSLNFDKNVSETRKSMYYCLTDLSRILCKANFADNYSDADEEFKRDCFQTFATAVECAFESDGGITTGVGDMSLSSRTSS